jgi:predicted acetyltransferase
MNFKLDRYEEGSDREALSRMISLAFGSSAEGVKTWLASTGAENFRVMRGDASGGVKACMLRVPMGQWYGGRSVPLVGIAGVAVPPEERGQGLGLAMMRASMQELAAEGVAISGLFASTQALYRQVGFEQSGHWFKTRLPWAVLSGLGEFAAVRPVTEADMTAVKACYALYASRFDGMLDRGEYVWNRIRTNRDSSYNGYAIWGEDGTIEGYLFMSQTRLPSGRQEIALSDHAFVTRRAGLGLLRFLADFTMMAEEIVMNGGPIVPLVSLMPQQRYSVERREYSMTRIVSVPAAIAARGYAPGVEVEFEMRITDDVVPANAGVWRVAVSKGSGVAERVRAGGSSAEVRLDVRALAAIYCGFYTPAQCAMLGWVEGPAEPLRAMGTAFAAGTPWMTDMY